jgi:hypothetical protein
MDLKAKLKISSSWTTFIFGDFKVVMQILEKLARKEGKVRSYRPQAVAAWHAAASLAPLLLLSRKDGNGSSSD